MNTKDRASGPQDELAAWDPAKRFAEPPADLMARVRESMRDEPAPLLPEELRRREEALGLVADEEVEVPVAVVVRPAGGLRRVIVAREADVETHVGEHSGAVVPEQRVRVPAVLAEPRAA